MILMNKDLPNPVFARHLSLLKCLAKTGSGKKIKSIVKGDILKF